MASTTSMDQATDDHFEDTLLVDKLEDEQKQFCSTRATAYIAAFSSVVMAGTCMATSQLLGGSVPSFQLITWRFLVQTLLTGAYALSRGRSLALSKHQILPVMGCMILQAASSLARFTATISVSIGTVEGLIFSLTISINVALTYCKKAKGPWYLYMCGVLSCLGIILLTQPDFMFWKYHQTYHGANATYDVHHKPWTAPCARNPEVLKEQLIHEETTSIINTNTSNHLNNEDHLPPLDVKHRYWLGILLACLTGVVMALRYELVHYIDDVGNTCLCFWIGVGGMAICIFGIPTEQLTLPSDPKCILLFVMFIMLQYNIPEPYCLQYLSPSVYALIKAQQLPVLFMLQSSMHGIFKPGLGNWLEYLGAVICVIACSFIPLYQIVSDLYYNHYKDKDANVGEGGQADGTNNNTDSHQIKETSLTER